MIITESDINEYVKKVYCYNGANAYKVDRVVLHRTFLDSTLDSTNNRSEMLEALIYNF